MATAEFSEFPGKLSAALSQHHLLGFEIAQLDENTCKQNIHSPEFCPMYYSSRGEMGMVVSA